MVLIQPWSYLNRKYFYFFTVLLPLAICINNIYIVVTIMSGHFCVFFFNSHLRIHSLILETEEEMEREGETSMWERNINQLPPAHMQSGDWTHYVARPKIEPAILWHSGRHSNQLNHLVRARKKIFYKWIHVKYLEFKVEIVSHKFIFLTLSVVL